MAEEEQWDAANYILLKKRTEADLARLTGGGGGGGADGDGAGAVAGGAGAGGGAAVAVGPLGGEAGGVAGGHVLGGPPRPAGRLLADLLEHEPLPLAPRAEAAPAARTRTPPPPPTGLPRRPPPLPAPPDPDEDGHVVLAGLRAAPGRAVVRGAGPQPPRPQLRCPARPLLPRLPLRATHHRLRPRGRHSWKRRGPFALSGVPTRGAWI